MEEKDYHWMIAMVNATNLVEQSWKFSIWVKYNEEYNFLDLGFFSSSAQDYEPCFVFPLMIIDWYLEESYILICWMIQCDNENITLTIFNEYL